MSDMSMTESSDKVTIQEAARALNVDQRTIYRWIGKGSLSKVKEAGKTYILLSDVKALLEKNVGHVGQIDSDVRQIDKTSDSVKPGNNSYVVDKIHYEGLLVKLGQMEAERRYLLEYKTGLEAKDRELSEAKTTITDQQAEIIQKEKELSEAERLLREKNKVMERAGRRIQELQRENERLRLPFWKRWLKGK